MTVLTKIHVKKPDVTNSSLLLDDVYKEEKIEIQKPKSSRKERRRRFVWALLDQVCLLLAMVLLLTVGAFGGMFLYRSSLELRPVTRFKGFCAVPVDDQMITYSQRLNFRPRSSVGELLEATTTDYRFGATQGYGDDFPDFIHYNYNPDMEDKREDVVNYLREELDIEDGIEKINVAGGLSGYTDYVHDWVANISGIIDSERCFVMDMDPGVVLPPSVFVMSIEKGEEFDLSRVRSGMMATLPPLRDLTGLGTYIQTHCTTRPTYRLTRVQGSIKKRSAEKPKPDFMHFSGKHVLEIEVGNMDQVRDYEKKTIPA